MSGVLASLPTRTRPDVPVGTRVRQGRYSGTIPADERWVPAAPFRTSFRMLVDATGLPWQMVAGLARVPTRVAARLVSDPPPPRHRLRQIDGQRICLLSARSVRCLRHRRVPAATARRRLRRLERQCSRLEVARRTGVARRELDLLSRASTSECSELTARLLLILENELQESSVGPVRDDLSQPSRILEAA